MAEKITSYRFDSLRPDVEPIESRKLCDYCRRHRCHGPSQKSKGCTPENPETDCFY